MRRIKKRHIVLAVLLILLISLASLVFWQRENIKALLDYTNYSKEELEEQLKQNDQTIKDAVSAIPDVTVRDITEEEREALKNGELTQQELIDHLVGKETPVTEQPTEPSSKPSESPNQEMNNDTDNTSEPVPDKETEPIPEQSDYEKRLSELVAEVYVLREAYLIALDELLAEAKAVYKSTPEAQRTGYWLADMVSSYLAKGTALEKEFQSPAMRDIMLEGLRAYERKTKDNGASWEAYLAKYYDKVANLDEELDLKGLLIDFSTTIGQLELNQVYEMKFENEVENDPKYGTVYIVSVERKNYSAGHYCPSEAFSDLDTSLWYHEATDYVLIHDMMNGVGDGKFDPNGTTTRAMIVTILWRLEGKTAVEAENLFEDVAEETWYTEAVIWAADKEVVKGYGNGSFGPDDPITREQLATILYRYSEYKEYDMSAGDSADLSVFTDADTVSDWALSAVKWAYAEKIVEGMGNDLLNPVGHATRVQAAAMLMRYCLNVAA